MDGRLAGDFGLFLSLVFTNRRDKERRLVGGGFVGEGNKRKRTQRLLLERQLVLYCNLSRNGVWEVLEEGVVRQFGVQAIFHGRVDLLRSGPMLH